MDTENKRAASFNAAPETEDCSTSDEGGTGAKEKGEIKRDLKSRHINMIAIAGLIVRVLSSNHDPGESTRS